MTPEQQKLREAVARTLCIEHRLDPDEPCGDPEGNPSNAWPRWAEFQTMADAAIAACRPFHRAEALEEAARVAEGPPYRTSGTTGEVSIRGGDDGNWSVPMPLAGYKGSDYGTGRYDAAAAIRALIPSESETGERG